MKIINEFINHINNGENSFIINRESKCIVCTCATIGRAKFVYANYSYRSITSIDKMELIAIVVDETIYIVSDYILDVWRNDNDELPENVIRFSEATKDYNYRAKSYFQSFYDGLSVEEAQMEEIIKDYGEYDLQQRARRYILDGKGQPEISLSEEFITTYEIRDILAGYEDFDKIVFEKLETDKKSWLRTKAYRTVIKNLMESSTIVKPEEVEICKALNNFDAKTVTVEFNMNGTTATGKVNPQEIVRMIINNDYFSNYNFCNGKEGGSIIKKLGASAIKWGGENGNVLTCKHIVKITYGKKVIYIKS